MDPVGIGLMVVLVFLVIALVLIRWRESRDTERESSEKGGAREVERPEASSPVPAGGAEEDSYGEAGAAGDEQTEVAGGGPAVMGRGEVESDEPAEPAETDEGGVQSGLAVTAEGTDDGSAGEGGTAYDQVDFDAGEQSDGAEASEDSGEWLAGGSEEGSEESDEWLSADVEKGSEESDEWLAADVEKNSEESGEWLSGGEESDEELWDVPDSVLQNDDSDDVGGEIDADTEEGSDEIVAGPEDDETVDSKEGADGEEGAPSNEEGEPVESGESESAEASEGSDERVDEESETESGEEPGFGIVNAPGGESADSADASEAPEDSDASKSTPAPESSDSSNEPSVLGFDGPREGTSDKPSD